MGKTWDVLAPRNLELGPLAGQADASSPWRNFKLARAEDGIAWLVLDKPYASANTLSVDALRELDSGLLKLEEDPPKGLGLPSAKPAGLISGADIGEFGGMIDVAMIEERLREANAVVDRLDRLA